MAVSIPQNAITFSALETKNSFFFFGNKILIPMENVPSQGYQHLAYWVTDVTSLLFTLILVESPGLVSAVEVSAYALARTLVYGKPKTVRHQDYMYLLCLSTYSVVWWISFTEHKFKDKFIKNFRAATIQHWTKSWTTAWVKPPWSPLGKAVVSL